MQRIKNIDKVKNIYIMSLINSNNVIRKPNNPNDDIKNKIVAEVLLISKPNQYILLISLFKWYFFKFLQDNNE